MSARVKKNLFIWVAITISAACGILLFMGTRGMLRAQQQDVEGVGNVELQPGETRVVSSTTTELVSERTGWKRVHEIEKEVEFIDPLTDEVVREVVKSKIAEVGSGLNYWDENQAAWLPSNPHFVAVRGGFELAECGYKASFGTSLTDVMTQEIDGVTIPMKLEYIVVSDGANQTTLAPARNVTGHIDENDPSVLHFTGAFNNIDVTYRAFKGGFHQDVKLKDVDALKFQGINAEAAKVYVYTSIDNSDFAGDRVSTTINADEEINTGLAVVNTRTLDDEQLVFSRTVDNEEKQLFFFDKSPVLDASGEEVAFAGRQLWKNQTTNKLYLVESVALDSLDDGSVIDYQQVANPITVAEVWTADVEYYRIVDDINVSAQLTIEPGTVIKYDAGKSLFINSNGRIIAEGEPYNYIIFTAYSGSSAGSYDEAIYINGGDYSSIIRYCKFEYAASAIQIRLTYLEAPIRDNIISDCAYGIRTLDGCYQQEITNNLIYDCTTEGIGIHGLEGDFYIYSNTIDGCGVGIKIHGDIDIQSPSVTIRDTIITNWTTYGIQDFLGADNDIDYVTYYPDQASWKNGVDGGEVGGHTVALASSPYDASCATGDYYLNSTYISSYENDGEATATARGFDDGPYTYVAPTTASSTITEPWSKDADPGYSAETTVTRGYHHNRVDKLIDDETISISADLTIEPGVVIALSTSSMSAILDVGSGKKLTCKGTVDEPIIFTNAIAPSMSVTPAPYRDMYQGLVNIGTGSSADTEVEYTTFQGLGYSLFFMQSIDSEVTGCIFRCNYTGLYAYCHGDFVNNLFFRNGEAFNNGAPQDTHIVNIRNNTFDGNATGIYSYVGGSITTNITDNLFTNNVQGLDDDGGGTINLDSNAWWGNTDNIDSATLSEPSPLAGDPYDDTWETNWVWNNRWFLDQAGDCVNGGSTDAYTSRMSKHTTDGDDYLTDTGDLDIGYHYWVFTDTADTDDMNDHWEAELANDADDPEEDLDGDMLTNGEEYDWGTDPHNPDTDGDGLPDGWEAYWTLQAGDAQGKLDPLNSYSTGTAVSDGNRDDDGDGTTNSAELLANANPGSPLGNPEFIHITEFYPPIGETYSGGSTITIRGSADRELSQAVVYFSHVFSVYGNHIGDRVWAKLSPDRMSFEVEVPLKSISIGDNQFSCKIVDVTGIETDPCHAAWKGYSIVKYDPGDGITWSNLSPVDEHVSDTRAINFSGTVSSIRDCISDVDVYLNGSEKAVQKTGTFDPTVTSTNFSTTSAQNLVNGRNVWEVVATVKKAGESDRTYRHQTMVVYYSKAILSSDIDHCNPVQAGNYSHLRVRQQEFNEDWYSASPFSEEWTDGTKHVRGKQYMLMGALDPENDIPPSLPSTWTYLDPNGYNYDFGQYVYGDLDVWEYNGAICGREYYLADTSLVFLTKPIPNDVETFDYLLTLSNVLFEPTYNSFYYEYPSLENYFLQGSQLQLHQSTYFARTAELTPQEEYRLTVEVPDIICDFERTEPDLLLASGTGPFFSFRLRDVKPFYMHIEDIFYTEGRSVKNWLPAGASRQLHTRLSPTGGQDPSWQLLTANPPVTLSAEGVLTVKASGDDSWASKNVWEVEIKATLTYLGETTDDTTIVTVSRESVGVMAEVDDTLRKGEWAPVYVSVYNAATSTVVNAGSGSTLNWIVSWQAVDDPTGASPPNASPNYTPPQYSSWVVHVDNRMSYPSSWLHTGLVHACTTGLVWVRAVARDTSTSTNYASPWRLVRVISTDLDVDADNDGTITGARVSDPNVLYGLKAGDDYYENMAPSKITRLQDGCDDAFSQGRMYWKWDEFAELKISNSGPQDMPLNVVFKIYFDESRIRVYEYVVEPCEDWYYELSSGDEVSFDCQYTTYEYRVEGRTAGLGTNDITLQCYVDGEPVRWAKDTVKVTVIKLDLIEPTVDEEHEEEPGAFIVVNDDDDNDNDTDDWNDDMTDPRLAVEGDDVRKLQVVLEPESMWDEGEVKLYFGYGSVNVYEKDGATWSKHQEVGYQPISVKRDAEYYYEAKAPCKGACLTSKFIPTGLADSDVRDSVEVNAPGLDIDVDSDYDNDVDSDDDDFEESRGCIVIRDHDDVYSSDSQPARRKQLIIRDTNPQIYDGSVVLSRSSANIRLFDAEEGGSEITFNGTDNVFDPPKTLWIQGGTTGSTSQGEEYLSVGIPNGIQDLDRVSVTVLWIDIEQRGYNAAPIDGSGVNGKISATPVNSFAYKFDLGVHEVNFNDPCVHSVIEIVGVLSPSVLDLGKQIPVDAKDDTPSAGLAVVDLGFIWERRAETRLYRNGNPEPVQGLALSHNKPDNTYMYWQDTTPNTDSANRLVIADCDGPQNRLFSGLSLSRTTRRLNMTQWVTITLADGADDGDAESLAERCSSPSLWSAAMDITRDDKGTPADESDDSFNYTDPANNGSGDNELYTNQHIALSFDMSGPTVTGISPSTGEVGQTVNVTITGTGFDIYAEPYLENGGTKISATNVNRTSLTSMTCSFNLVGAETGSWAVKAKNADGQVGSYESFTITE